MDNQDEIVKLLGELVTEIKKRGKELDEIHECVSEMRESVIAVINAI